MLLPLGGKSQGLLETFICSPFQGYEPTSKIQMRKDCQKPCL